MSGGERAASDEQSRMKDFASLTGKRLLVTGADSGIGRAFVELAVGAGALVAALVHEDSGALDGLVPADRRYVADLANAARAAAATRDAIDALGGIDGLVASAGVFVHLGGLETEADDWDRVLDVNLRGTFVVARECGKAMQRQQSGAIVLVSSQIGQVGHPRAAAYAASKSGVNGLVRAMALELAPASVRVNGVAPGPVATPMTAEAMADPERAARLTAQIPLGRLGTAAEIAAAIRFLLADDASFVSGQILTVDGGITAA